MVFRSQSRKTPVCSVRFDMEDKVNDTLETASGFSSHKLWTNSVRNFQIQSISDSNAKCIIFATITLHSGLLSLRPRSLPVSLLSSSSSPQPVTCSPYSVLFRVLQTAAWEIFITEKSNLETLRVQS